MQPTGAPAPYPATQGDQIVGQWVRAPSCVSGLSLIPLTPDTRQEGFIVEARGTCRAIDVAQVTPCVAALRHRLPDNCRN